MKGKPAPAPAAVARRAPSSPQKPRRNLADEEAAAFAASIQAVKAAFDIEGLTERMQANVSAHTPADSIRMSESCCSPSFCSLLPVQIAHWTRVNAAELDPALAKAEADVRAKQRADDVAHNAAQQEREQQTVTEEQEEEKQPDSSTAAAAADSAPVLTTTSRGRAVKKAEPPGKPLAALGHVSPKAKKKQPPRYNTDEYRRLNHERFHAPAALQAEKLSEEARAKAARAQAAVDAAAAYSSSTLCSALQLPHCELELHACTGDCPTDIACLRFSQLILALPRASFLSPIHCRQI